MSSLLGLVWCLIYCGTLVNAYAGEKLASSLIQSSSSLFRNVPNNNNNNKHQTSTARPCPGAMRNRLHKKEFSIHKDAVNGTYTRMSRRGSLDQLFTYLWIFSCIF